MEWLSFLNCQIVGQPVVHTFAIFLIKLPGYRLVTDY